MITRTTLWKLCATAALALMLGGGTALAQGSNPTPAPQPEMGPKDAETKKPAIETPSKQAPGKVIPPMELRQAARQFRLEREKLLKEVQALVRERKDILPPDREAAKEEMRERFQRLKDQQQALRKETMDRMKDIKTELAPELGRNISGAQNEGRGR